MLLLCRCVRGVLELNLEPPAGSLREPVLDLGRIRHVTPFGLDPRAGEQAVDTTLGRDGHEQHALHRTKAAHDSLQMLPVVDLGSRQMGPDIEPSGGKHFGHGDGLVDAQIGTAGHPDGDRDGQCDGGGQQLVGYG